MSDGTDEFAKNANNMIMNNDKKMRQIDQNIYLHLPWNMVATVNIEKG